MSDLTFDQIAATDDRAIAPVDVPEWGGRVYVRVLDADEVVSYFEAAKKPEGEEYDERALKRELVARACCSADGAPLFKSAAAVKGSNWRVFSRIYAAAAKANGLGADEAAEKKDSPGAPAAGSRTA